MDNMPKDEWTCEVCGKVNNNWRIDVASVISTGQAKYIHGLCGACLAKKTADYMAYNETVEKRDRKSKVDELIIRSKIPPKISSAKFSDLNITKGAELAFKTMQRMANADRWIYLFGKNSTGKSLLTGATINKLAEELVPSFYFNERGLFRRIRDSYDPSNNETSYRIFEWFKKADIVFWDDFSTMPYNDWEMGTAYDILEYCETHYKKLVMISNVNLEQEIASNIVGISERIGQRAIARIRRNNVFYIHMKNNPF